MLEWVIRSAEEAGCEKVLLVVGHQADRVRTALENSDTGVEIEFVEQTDQQGTGDALARAVAHLRAPARLLVLSGDVPLVHGETLRALLVAAGDGWALAVADLDSPGSLGRVVAGTDGCLSRIVEAADATDEELGIRSVNAGIYVTPSAEIEPRLARLEPANTQGELYLTDAFSAAVESGTEVELFALADSTEALGVNDRADLARVHRVLLDRKCAHLMTSGVTILEPARTVVEADVRVGRDSVIHPGVSLLGRTTIGVGSTVHSNSWIRDSTLGSTVEIGPGTVIEEAEIGDGSRVGPFARLRPGARLGESNRIGNFVEIKNSRLGDGVKAGHLAYLGDAEIGDGANIGAGTITCNYDGENKHRTEIGARAFVGSDTMLVAPVRVGERATTGAGSVITTDVPDGALGVSRAKQRNLEAWSERKKRRSKD
jgi:bifunctional UDP-N-acetylglucosamine pyrophosphorylase/glucosamine-1-phosphate N-acetyltransferase